MKDCRDAFAILHQSVVPGECGRRRCGFDLDMTRRNERAGFSANGKQVEMPASDEQDFWIACERVGGFFWTQDGVPAAVFFAQMLGARQQSRICGNDNIVIIARAVGNEPAKAGGFERESFYHGGLLFF